MEEILDIGRELLENRIIRTLLVILINLIIYIIIKKIIYRGRNNKKLSKKIDNRTKTYIRLFNNVLKYAFIITTILSVLQINGVNVTSFIAGLGIASIIVGLALQDALKDIIMGVNILTDHYFSVGDVIKYNGLEGKVVGFGLKTTKIQDIATGNEMSITNRSITEAEKLSNKLYISIPAPYEASVSKMEKVIIKIILRIKEGDYIDDCDYLGISEFKDSCVIYKVVITAKPEYKYAVIRHANRAIKNELDINHISIPYTQIVVRSE